MTSLRTAKIAVDLSSRALPDLERKPGGPDNWVEAAGGLPDYIERIAKNLHYKRGFTISHAIASAVNTVKRWARGGHVTKHGTVKRVSPATVAKSIKAVAEWEAKKKAGSLALSDEVWDMIDLAEGEKSHLKAQKCKYCKNPASRSILWAEGMAYIPVCMDHLEKGKSDVTDPFTGKPDPSEINKIYDLTTKKPIDLAAADVSATDTMVAFMLPEDLAEEIAVEGGTPVDEMHITIAFYGDLNDSQFDDLVEALKSLFSDWQGQTEYKGTIGGIGAFPAKDPEKGTPWWVPVNIVGLTTLHDQITASTPDSIDFEPTNGYTPHVTLIYSDEAPDPVEEEEVAFDRVWVVRGNTQVVEIPIGKQTGAGSTDHAILGDDNLKTSGQQVNLQDLADRAATIADPELRAAARAKILDLAGPGSTIPPKRSSGKTSDNRPSYKRQGKWGHGFVPLDKAAKEAKAKGSPKAMQRVNRVFKGTRAGQRTAGSAKRNTTRVAVNERGTRENATSLGALRNASFEDARHTERQTTKSNREISKSSRIPDRATQNWDEIPSTLKTVRNGKRYVVAEFQGKQVITEWVGGTNTVDSTPLSKRKLMRTITAADAASMSAAEIRNMLDNPRTPKSLRKILNQALRAKQEESK